MKNEDEKKELLKSNDDLTDEYRECIMEDSLFFSEKENDKF